MTFSWLVHWEPRKKSGQVAYSQATWQPSGRGKLHSYRSHRISKRPGPAAGRSWLNATNLWKVPCQHDILKTYTFYRKCSRATCHAICYCSIYGSFLINGQVA